MTVPQIITELPGPRAKALIERDRRDVSPSYTRDYPLVAAKGRGCCIEDVDGNLFLDMTAGIAVTATGHCHPKVVAAIQAQAEKLIHMSGTDFYYEPQIALAEKLAALAPGTADKKVFFCNSGAEANEAAIKLARFHTGRTHLIGFYGAFHGRTCGALSLTASKPIQKHGFLPLLPGVHHAPYPNPRRCPQGTDPEDYARQCVQWIKEQLFEKTLPPSQVAAIMVEPIQGEGGYIVPPPNFHQELRTLCDTHDILLIMDEIQAGTGRTGKFFACEHFDVVPDIITMAKGIASGLPLGAMISTAEIMDWPPGAHASTFGGNPVACAAALSTLELVEAELMANAAKQGELLKQELKSLSQQYPWIADVRGLGLMIAIEIDGDSSESAVALRNKIIQAAFHKGLLLLGCGKQAIRFSPALIISSKEIQTAMKIFADVCSEVEP